jgi:hypothetical protein
MRCENKTKVSVTRECFDAFVDEAGLSPTTPVQTLALLPMNTTGSDAHKYVTKEVLTNPHFGSYSGKSTHMYKFHYNCDIQSVSTIEISCVA